MSLLVARRGGIASRALVPVEFDPLSIDWYAAFYADDLALSDGAAVSAWSDSSGNGNDLAQATAGLQPVYRASVSALNGQPAVEFDGVDDWIRSARFSPAGAYAVALVFEGASATNQEQMVGRHDLTTDRPIIRSLNGQWGITETASFSAGTADSNPHLMVATFAGSGQTSEIYVDGTSHTGDTGAFSPDLLRLGTDYDGSSPFGGNIAFAAVYEGIMSTSDKEDLLAWYQGKYVASYTAVVLADSPIAYWRLGEASGTTAADEVGNHDGTYQGTPILGVAGALDGDPDTAVDTDALGYVEVPDDPAWDLQTLTFEAWVNFNTIGTSTFFIHQGAGSGYNWGLYDTSSGVFFYLRAGGSVTTLGTDGALATGVWHHIVATYDGVDMRLYHNGAEVPASPVAKAGTVSTNADPLHLGGLWNGKIVDAKIDEIAIYDYALTAQQASDHYAAGAP